VSVRKRRVLRTVGTSFSDERRLIDVCVDIGEPGGVERQNRLPQDVRINFEPGLAFFSTSTVASCVRDHRVAVDDDDVWKKTLGLAYQAVISAGAGNNFDFRKNYATGER